MEAANGKTAIIKTGLPGPLILEIKIWFSRARFTCMKYRFKDILSVLLFLVIIAAVLWFILSRLLIVILIPVSFGGAVLFILVAVVVIFLVLDHFLDLL
jgi:hypothetical protein